MANVQGSVNNWGCVKAALKKYLKLSNWQIDKLFEFIKNDLPNTPSNPGALAQVENQNSEDAHSNN